MKKEITDNFGVKYIYYYKNRNLKERYDLNPYKIDVKYPKNYKSYEKILNEKQKHLPITKRKYIHPEEGYEIGYGAYMNYVKQGLCTHPKNI